MTTEPSEAQRAADEVQARAHARNMREWRIGIAAIIVLFFTNPSEEQHAARIGEAYKKAHPIASLLIDAKALALVGGHRSTFLIFSIMGPKDTSGVWSIGVLGMVFVTDTSL